MLQRLSEQQEDGDAMGGPALQLHGPHRRRSVAAGRAGRALENGAGGLFLLGSPRFDLYLGLVQHREEGDCGAWRPR